VFVYSIIDVQLVYNSGSGSACTHNLLAALSVVLVSEVDHYSCRSLVMGSGATLVIPLLHSSIPGPSSP